MIGYHKLEGNLIKLPYSCLLAKKALWGQQFQFHTLNKRQIILRAHFANNTQLTHIFAHTQEYTHVYCVKLYLVGHFAALVWTVFCMASTCLECLAQSETWNKVVATPTPNSKTKCMLHVAGVYRHGSTPVDILCTCT